MSPGGNVSVHRKYGHRKNGLNQSVLFPAIPALFPSSSGFYLRNSLLTNSSFVLPSETTISVAPFIDLCPISPSLPLALLIFPHFPLSLFLVAGPAFCHLYSSWPTPPFCQDPAEKIDEISLLSVQSSPGTAPNHSDLKLPGICSWECIQFGQNQ